MGYILAEQVVGWVVESGAGGTVVVVADDAAAVVAVVAGAAIAGHNRSSHIKHYVLVGASEEAEVLTIVDCNRQGVLERVVVLPELPSNYSLVVQAVVEEALGVTEAGEG